VKTIKHLRWILGAAFLGTPCIWMATTLAVPSDAQKASAPIVGTELGTKLDEYLRRLDTLGFSGAVIVVKDGRTVLEKGYGYANRERRIPNRVDTVLPVGSITKQFTAAAILKLEMQGKLKTTDLMSKYITNVPADKAGITLHQLLTHTAGFDESYGNDDENISRNQFLERVLKAPLQFPPGKEYLYSNAGYSLLAVIIELLSNQSWERYLHEQLFVPAGMLRTGCVIPHWEPDTLAHGYLNGQDKGTFLQRFGNDGPFWNQRGNGGILSTVGDMYKWHQALLGQTVLSEEAKRKLYTPYVREGPDAPTFYGYGWVIGKTQRGTTVIMHNGGNGVFAADFLRFIDDKVVLYAASNSAQMMAWQVTPNIARLVFDENVVYPPKVVELSAAELDKITGIYAVGSSDSRLIVRASDNHLEIVGDGQSAISALDPMAARQERAFNDLNARTERMLLEAQDGRYDLLIEAMGAGPEKEQIKERHDLERNRRETQLGPWKDFHVLGTIRGPEARAVTIVREDHERGAVYLEYIRSQEGTVMGVHDSQAPPGLTFFPESSDALFAFDLESSQIARVGLVHDSSGAIGGLKLATIAGDVIASRTH
jgi:CubicO group peptidase (beta-lactamase class C family)